MSGHITIYRGRGWPGRNQTTEQSSCYLADLERQGCVDADLFINVASSLPSQGNSREVLSRKLEYLQRGMDMGHGDAYIEMSNLFRSSEALQDKNRAIDILIGAGEKGVRDDRVLLAAIDYLDSLPRSLRLKLHGEYVTKDELTLYICDLLIQRESPIGYERKALLCESGVFGLWLREEKAVAISREAGQVGLATYDMYVGIVTHPLVYKDILIIYIFIRLDLHYRSLITMLFWSTSSHDHPRSSYYILYVNIFRPPT